MKDEEKSTDQLIDELKTLRKQVDEIGFRKREVEFSHTLLNLIEGPISVVDPEMKYVFVNKKASQLLNIDSKDIEGKTIFQLFPESEAIPMVESLKRVFKKGVIIQQEREFQLSGQTIWLDTEVIPVKNDSGIVENVISISRDITDRKKTEDKLQESTKRFRTLSEASFEAIFLSEKGICLEQNQTAEKMFGYTHSEAIGKQGTNWINPEHRELVKSHMMSGYEEPYEVSALRKDGTSFPAEIQGKMMHFNGRDVRVTALRNINDRKRVEEDLKESEEKYRELVQSSNSIIVKFDQDSRITFINIYAQDFFGFSEDEVIGESLIGTIVPEIESTGRNLEKIIEEIFDHPEAYALNENENICKNGKRVWVAWRNKGIYNNKGQLSGILCTGYDITERKQTEKALQDSKQITNILFEISNAVNTTLNLNDLYFSIHNSLKKVIEATNFFIGLYDEENDKLSFPYMADEYLDKYPNAPLENASKSGAFVYQVINQNERLFVDRNEAGMLEQKIGEEIVGQHPEQWLGVPLNARGKTIGGMVVQSYTNPNRYTRSDADLLSAVSHQVALAIDRKASEQALIESEEKHREIITTLNEGYYEVDLTGNFTYLNDALAKMLGKNVNELIGVNNRTYMSKDTLKDVFECFNSVYETKKPSTSFNWELIRLDDGSPCYIEHSVLPRFDQNGNVIGFRGIAHEITQRKLAEEEVEKLAMVVKHSSELVNLATLDGRMTFLNEAGCKMLGIDPEEVANTYIMEVIPEHLKGMVTTELFPALLRSETWEGDLQYQNLKTKQLVDLHATAFTVQDPVTGAPLYLANVSLDITDRKRIEEALRDSESKNRTVIENATEAICVVQNDKFKYFNPATVKLFAYSKEELEQLPAAETINPEDKESVISPGFQIEKQEQLLGNYSHRIVTKNGRSRWVDINAVNIAWNDSPAALVFLTDITERKQSEKLMIQSEKMLSLGGLAAGMAHELNNPLGGMLQGVQNVQRRLSPDLKSNRKLAEEFGIDLHNLQLYLEKRDILSFLKGIMDSGKKASSIISNMLQFSRKSESQMAPTNLVKLIENVLDLAGKDYDLKKKHDFRNIKVTKEIDSGLPLVPCTETEIEQVFLNLFRNAAQAMIGEKQEGPHTITIRLRMSNAGKKIRIEVEDNGPGMNKETQNRIFEPFFTTKSVGEGTGLGLSVSYMIITNNHKGTMDVESEVGKGTRFIIQLPLHRDSAS